LVFALSAVLAFGCGGSDNDGPNNDPGPDDIRGEGGSGGTAGTGGDGNANCTWTVEGDAESGVGSESGSCSASVTDQFVGALDYVTITGGGVFASPDLAYQGVAVSRIGIGIISPGLSDFDFLEPMVFTEANSGQAAVELTGETAFPEFDIGFFQTQPENCTDPESLDGLCLNSQKKWACEEVSWSGPIWSEEEQQYVERDQALGFGTFRVEITEAEWDNQETFSYVRGVSGTIDATCPGSWVYPQEEYGFKTVGNVTLHIEFNTAADGS